MIELNKFWTKYWNGYPKNSHCQRSVAVWKRKLRSWWSLFKNASGWTPSSAKPNAAFASWTRGLRANWVWLPTWRRWPTLCISTRCPIDGLNWPTRHCLASPPGSPTCSTDTRNWTLGWSTSKCPIPCGLVDFSAHRYIYWFFKENFAKFSYFLFLKGFPHCCDAGNFSLKSLKEKLF